MYCNHDYTSVCTDWFEGLLKKTSEPFINCERWQLVQSESERLQRYLGAGTPQAVTHGNLMQQYSGASKLPLLGCTAGHRIPRVESISGMLTPTG